MYEFYSFSMKEILINQEIGGWWGVTANDVRKQFNEAGDDEIKLVVDCPGGDCFEGISIYNFIRDYARNHSNKITTYIQGMACSAASWIACAANSVNKENKIIVEDNSIFMIHNCWGVAIGDYREMEKSADFSKRIDSLIINMLSARSGKDSKEISKLMDDETWYFGNEILEAGFCDEVISCGEEDPLLMMDNKLDAAKVAFNSCQKKIKDEVEKNPKQYKDCFDKSYSAFNLISEKSEFSDSNKTSENSEKGEVTVMNEQELMAQHPDLYNEIVNKGAAAAVEKEKKRVSDLLTKFEKAGNVNAATAFIQNGKSITDEEVVDALLDTQAKSKGLSDRKTDDPADFTPAPNPKNGSGETEEELATKAFNAAMGVK